ncbi:retrovirus-related Pol polyprotein from type-1 retrotransposable element R1 [Parasteatoda tepidariorum]|uniref:retrovirus-related Pol polyprotein from type-1 retrotransposable element R1 n=1 Tax=Parasteatoda tepidariorum TaxID=114398 RepID=UPI0039BC9650
MDVIIDSRELRIGPAAERWECKTICFTDGSKLDGRVCLAFVIYENGTEKVSAKHRLHNECTVFPAELLCINLVVTWIQNSFSENQIFKYLICTDSLSSLFLLRDTTSTEKLVVEIHSILNALENVTIHFSYVRGHSGILGNERADQLAREATCGEIDLRVSVPASHWKRIARDKIIADWNAEFLASPRSLWTKRFFPSIFHRLQCKFFATDFKLTQILTNHGNFKRYLFRFHLQTSGICACGDADEDAEHILLHCSLYASARMNLKTDLRRLSICWPPVLSELVKSIESLAALRNFVFNVNL